MSLCPRWFPTSWVWLALFAAFSAPLARPARAQDMGGQAASASESSSPEASDTGEGPRVSNSSVGYIDPAIPGNVIRFRYDAAYHNNRPTRGEFYYARQAPDGRGLPLPETNVDFQDVSLYLEHAFTKRFSAFVEIPFRSANYAINTNQSGLSDVTAGFKFAFVATDDTVASFQLRTFAPTGDVHSGLGTGHTSVEPALLLFQRFSERLASESELRLWVPIGGQRGFESDVVRYGTGLHYDIYKSECLTVAPVVEAVGWTFLNGRQEPVLPSGLELPERTAGGNTIVNLKFGLRTRYGNLGDIYAGYGRAMTGDVLYKDIYRVELRLFY